MWQKMQKGWRSGLRGGQHPALSPETRDTTTPKNYLRILTSELFPNQQWHRTLGYKTLLKTGVFKVSPAPPLGTRHTISVAIWLTTFQSCDTSLEIHGGLCGWGHQVGYQRTLLEPLVLSSVQHLSCGNKAATPTSWSSSLTGLFVLPLLRYLDPFHPCRLLLCWYSGAAVLGYCIVT